MTDLSILDAIDPSQLSYEEWLAVGMALKHEGKSPDDWDAWSRRDSKRFHEGECSRKWTGFNGGGGAPVTGGTLVELARRQGWMPPHRNTDCALDWDATINTDDLRIIDPGWIEDAELRTPDVWNPVRELSLYLRTLFSAEEYVGYVVESWTADDGRRLPQKGTYTRTAGEILDALSKCDGDIGAAIGDCEPDVGAWIRFNPLDGQGIRDANVTAYRFALVESDTIPVERQAAIYAEIELPVAALVHSGGKSLHAIVRIDATSKEEYRERVQFLHQVCARNGLEIDTQNKNPSRLSRMPGIMRNGHKQYLVAVNQGRASWDEWREWIEEANDSLPDFECLAEVFDDLPDLAPPLIDGVLREGHKMLLAGPSKAGKSYMLLQLVAAIAEGRKWLGWQCKQGRVLYVNLELDRVSCLHRLKGLYAAHGWTPANIANIDLWNLRGKAVPMDALAPKLIRRALKKRYAAVVIDPIYKVITGDENAADKMAHFCNQFDRVCAELGSAVIYCHHHSKGAQGGKLARDRSSGSGVFARDPDALLDIIELAVTEPIRKQQVNQAVCAALIRGLDAAATPNWRDDVSQDDMLVADRLAVEARRLLGPGCDIDEDIRAATERAMLATGLRLEGTLREFAPFAPRNLWFQMPLHIVDDTLLADAKADGEEPPWKRSREEKKQSAKDRRQERIDATGVAYQAAAFDGSEVTMESLAECMGVSVQTVRKRVKEHPNLGAENGKITWVAK